MTRLVIQIPALNEEDQLPSVLSNIPRSIPGIDEILVVVIDDGSVDRTSEVAFRSGVDYVLRFKKRQGLARAFSAGLNFGSKVQADYLVNIDADHQYDPREIESLIQPLLTREADVVIGDRQTWGVREFSLTKRILQKMGSKAASKFCGIAVLDATSGFRAYTMDCASSLRVTSQYTYTLETLVQLGMLGFCVRNVPVSRLNVTRPSRLFRSNSQYIWKNGTTLLRLWIAYRPMPVFFSLFAFFALVCLGLLARFAVVYAQGGGQGNVQSLVVASLFGGVAVQFLGLGIIADQVNRIFRQKLRGPMPTESHE